MADFDAPCERFFNLADVVHGDAAQGAVGKETLPVRAQIARVQVGDDAAGFFGQHGRVQPVPVHERELRQAVHALAVYVIQMHALPRGNQAFGKQIDQCEHRAREQVKHGIGQPENPQHGHGQPEGDGAHGHDGQRVAFARKTAQPVQREIGGKECEAERDIAGKIGGGGAGPFGTRPKGERGQGEDDGEDGEKSEQGKHVDGFGAGGFLCAVF